MCQKGLHQRLTLNNLAPDAALAGYVSTTLVVEAVASGVADGWGIVGVLFSNHSHSSNCNDLPLTPPDCHFVKFNDTTTHPFPSLCECVRSGYMFLALPRSSNHQSLLSKQ
jgi:hypothetical protein